MDALIHRAAALATVALLSCTPNDLPASRPDAVEAARQRMVDEQLVARGISDERVLEAMRRVPRHELVPAAARDQAYADRPLSIGHGQTISQPYMVAAMTEALALAPGARVLEIGTGSGYQSAVLAAVGAEVYTIEIVAPLAERARADLERLGYAAHVRVGDGYRGWPEAAPFDAILLTAAPDHVPQPLLAQLAEGGRMVLPLGGIEQDLVRITRTPDGLVRETLFGVRFVPMTGEAERRP